MTTKTTPTLLQQYLEFKQQLLTAMTHLDPLSILQSQIFQKYQQNLTTQPITNLYNGDGQVKYEMETKINRYWIDGVGVDVVERRSHSCGDYVGKRGKGDGGRETERVWRNRVKRLEEQEKINLTIWSNIMNNHFRNQSAKYYPQQSTDRDNHSYSQNNMQASNTLQSSTQAKQKNNPSLKTPIPNPNLNSNTSINSNTQQNIQLSSSNISLNPSLLPNQPSTKFQPLLQKILQNPSKANIKLLLKQLFTSIEEDNEKMIGQLNKLRKQNDKLMKIIQDKSMKQLENIVQIKHMERKIQEKEGEIGGYLAVIRQKQEQIRDRQSQLNKIIRQKLRQIQNLQQQNIRKTSIEQLKQKMAIDSIRRVTLCTLSKQRFEIQLKKEQLGFGIGIGIVAGVGVGMGGAMGNNPVIGEFEDGQPETEETRCDDQLF